MHETAHYWQVMMTQQVMRPTKEIKEIATVPSEYVADELIELFLY